MPAFIDLTDERFGRLRVRQLHGKSKAGKYLWLCDCDCGEMAIVQSSNLTNDHTQSCGCQGKENRTKALTTHGKTETPEYDAWCHIRDRCHNPNNPAYHNYGNRGIIVCDRWRESFANFLADMGPRPEGYFGIDRFPDNDGNYEPGNCRWATAEEQNRNKRNNRKLTIDGETNLLCEWLEQFNIKRWRFMNFVRGKSDDHYIETLVLLRDHPDMKRRPDHKPYAPRRPK